MTNKIKAFAAVLLAAVALSTLMATAVSARQSDDDGGGGTFADGLSDGDVERIEDDCIAEGAYVDRKFSDNGAEDLWCAFPDGMLIWCVKGAGWTSWSCVQIPHPPPGVLDHLSTTAPQVHEAPVTTTTTTTTTVPVWSTTVHSFTTTSGFWFG